MAKAIESAAIGVNKDGERIYYNRCSTKTEARRALQEKLAQVRGNGWAVDFVAKDSYVLPELDMRFTVEAVGRKPNSRKGVYTMENENYAMPVKAIKRIALEEYKKAYDHARQVMHNNGVMFDGVYNILHAGYYAAKADFENAQDYTALNDAFTKWNGITLKDWIESL